MCMFGVLSAFWVAATASLAGNDPYAFTVFAIAPYVIACFLLSVQSFVKLSAAEGLARYLERTGGA